MGGNKGIRKSKDGDSFVMANLPKFQKKLTMRNINILIARSCFHKVICNFELRTFPFCK